ncbi:hypothetical protein BDD12DRAFT_803237 [Trichophaea hybrida]|nr:hypothetical protein BDD12DRAFT_803237 [Trichophaea hybrida]
MTWTCGCGHQASIIIDQATAESHRAMYECTAPGTASTETPPIPLNPEAPSVPTPAHLPEPHHSRASSTESSVPPSLRNSRDFLKRFDSTQRIMCCIPRTEQVSLLAQLPEEPTILYNDRKFFKDLSELHFSVSHATGLPRKNDPIYSEYEFVPKPPFDPPVIPTMNLLHFFNEPECAGTSRNFLQHIPKRVNGGLPNEVDIAWGLQLQQDLCGLRVGILLVGFWAGAAAVIELWVQRHPTDFPKVSAPLTAFIAVLGLLFTLRPPNSIQYHNLPKPSTTVHETTLDKTYSAISL